MTHPKKCLRCGSETPSNAPEGICPRCLVEINWETGTGVASGTGTGSGRPAPLPVEDVARCFPDLEILEVLGAGGMGAVYKARQPKLNRFVALKILNRHEEDPRFLERFTREAQTLARLNHPNIVAVYDFGQRCREEAKEGGDLFFLIMELVDGVTLRDLLRDGRMQPEQALAIVPPICEALQYAHEKGVVHRDIKPENILLDKEGRVKVADFGIARLAGMERVENLTREGQVVGTAHYMAPEQVERPASVDHRADIYALGVVFYEMLTGELPLGRFPHPSKKVQIDVRLDEVVLKALEKEPEQRYQHASEMRTGVETVRSTATEPKPAESGLRGKAVSAESRFSRTAIVGAVWSAFVLVGAFSLFYPIRVPTGAPPPFPVWRWFLLPLAVVGLAAPFGTTILGWIAVAQIRRFPEKLHGMGLAVFDGLLFPLVAYCGGVIFLGNVVADELARDVPRGPGMAWFTIAMVSAMAIGCILPSVLVVRWVWGALNRPVKDDSGQKRGPPRGGRVEDPRPFSYRALAGAGFVALGVLSLVGLAVVLIQPEPGRASAWILLGIAAVAGLAGTALGWMALSEDRRSEGQMRGRYLSALAALIFPLLLGAAIIVWLSFGLIGFSEGVLIALIVNGFLLWKIWPKLNFAASAGAMQRPWGVYAGTTAVVLLCAGLFMMVMASRHEHARVQLQEEVRTEIGMLLADQNITYSRMYLQFSPVLPRMLVSFVNLQGGANAEVGANPLNGDLRLRFDEPGFCEVSGTGDLGDITHIFPMPVAKKLSWPRRVGPTEDEQFLLSVAPHSSASGNRPQHADYGTNDHSAYLVHDGTVPHYILYYAGDFNSSSSATSNRVSLVWQDVVTIELKSNGRSFGLLRQSDSPERLILNGKRYHLREGHVFVLQDDGGVRQLALPIEMVSHDNLMAFGERVAKALAETAGRAAPSADLAKILTEFPHGVWNLPLVHYAQNRRPSGWVAFINFPPAEDTWINADDFNLPANVPGEDIAVKANAGALYVPDLDHLAPVRGTKLAPLVVKPLPPGREPEDHGTWSLVLPYTTRQEIAEVIEAYDQAHPAVHRGEKWVRMENGGRYAALRPDGELMLITAFGPAGNISVQLIPIGNVSDEGTPDEQESVPIGEMDGGGRQGSGSPALFTFGPVIERVLYPFLDLDSGKAFELPAEMEPKGETEMLRWIDENDIDLIANADGDRRRVLWTSARLASMDEAAWKKADQVAVSAALREGELNLKREEEFGQGRFYDVTGEELPITLAIETIQGSVGLLQVTDFAAERPGARVRYKIMQLRPAESFGVGELNPLPRDALAVQLRALKELYDHFNNSNDPNAIHQLAAEQPAIEREMRSLLKGTVAEPLIEQIEEQKRAFEKAHAIGDTAAMERAEAEMKALGDRLMLMFEDAGVEFPDKRVGLESSPDWGRRIVDGSADWKNAWKISGEIAALPPVEGLALMREHWSAISDPRSRERFLAAFVECGHPYLVGVLELGLLDPASEVKGAALRHLGAVALRDFSGDILAAEIFAMERRDRELTDVLAESAQWAAEGLLRGDRAVVEEVIPAMRSTPHFERHSEILKATRLEESFAVIVNESDWRFAREFLKAADALPLSEEWFRAVLLPKIGEENPEEIRTMAAGFLQTRGGPWAVEPLVDALVGLLDEPVEERMDLYASLAGALGGIGSPEAIPAMIGLLQADAAATYPVGHHGLGKLTGVDYHYRHDGAWWREWWGQNRGRFPEHVQNLTIPQFPSPEPSREMPAKVFALFEYLEGQVVEVDSAAAAGRILAMAPIFDEINELCDSLQGKNANPPPPVNEWGLPDVERQREVIQLLAGLEDQVERLRDAARNVPEPSAERAAALRQIWKNDFRPAYAELQKIWMSFERMIEVEPVLLEGPVDVWNWLTPASFDRRKLERDPTITFTALPSTAVSTGAERILALAEGEEPVKIRAEFLAGELIAYTVTGRFTKVDDEWIPADEPTESAGQVSWNAPMIFGLPAGDGRARALVLSLRPVVLWTDRQMK